MEVVFPLPPTFLPYLRDSVITFWNYAITLCDSMRISGYTVKNGLEYIILNVPSIDELYDCISKNFEKIGKWCSKESFEQGFHTILSVEEDYMKWSAGCTDKKNVTNYDYYRSMLDSLRKIHMYSYARGFIFLPHRRYELRKKKPRPSSGYLHINLGVDYIVFIIEGLKLGKVAKDISLLTTDIVADSVISKEFFSKEYEKMKEVVRNTLNMFRGKQKENPVIQDILMGRILLEIVNGALDSSIVYATNWPPLRLYINVGEQNEPSFMIIDLPNTIFDLAKAAVISSSDVVGMRPRELIKKVINILNEGITDNAGNLLSDLYILTNTILQGTPDVDLLYRVLRVVEVREGWS